MSGADVGVGLEGGVDGRGPVMGSSTVGTSEAAPKAAACTKLADTQAGLEKSTGQPAHQRRRHLVFPQLFRRYLHLGTSLSTINHSLIVESRPVLRNQRCRLVETYKDSRDGESRLW